MGKVIVRVEMENGDLVWSEEVGFANLKDLIPDGYATPGLDSVVEFLQETTEGIRG